VDPGGLVPLLRSILQFGSTDGKGTGRSRHVIAILTLPGVRTKFFHCFRWTCALIWEETVGEEH
jgi:hypothetical protein